MTNNMVRLMAVAAFCAAGVLSAAWAAGPSSGPASASTSASPGPRGGDREPPPLTAEQETELLKVLKERMPERYERLMGLKREHPMGYQNMLREHWRWYSMWQHAPREVQDAFVAEQKAKMRAIELARKVNEAPDSAQREQAMAQLRQVVGDQVDADLKVRQYRLNQAKADLERMQKELTRRTEQVEHLAKELASAPAQRDKRIDAQMQQMLRAASQPTSRPPHSRPWGSPPPRGE